MIIMMLIIMIYSVKITNNNKQYKKRTFVYCSVTNDAMELPVVQGSDYWQLQLGDVTKENCSVLVLHAYVIAGLLRHSGCMKAEAKLNICVTHS